MTELEFVRNKFKNKSFVEITTGTQMKVIDWLTGTTIKDGQNDIRKQLQKICERGFIKFLNEGVIVIKPETIQDALRLYPFRFRDDGKLEMSIYIYNPKNRTVHPLELLCKVEVGLDTLWKVIDGTWNQEVATAHIEDQVDFKTPTAITPIIRQVSAEHPELKPASKEWELEITKAYFQAIIKGQVTSVIGIHAYLALLEKEILITKIEQKKELKAGNSGGKKAKKNPLYRYVVELPPNYVPRKFDFNWVLSHWERQGHMTTRWVLPENAELLVQRRNGKLTGRTKGKYVGILIPVEPQICHRRRGNLDETHFGTKEYSTR